jgi:uncharacterized YccA/Bax inhibitor family protein
MKHLAIAIGTFFALLVVVKFGFWLEVFTDKKKKTSNAEYALVIVLFIGSYVLASVLGETFSSF